MLSLDFELVQPELVVNEDGRSLIDIKKGKHILQELCMDSGTFNANSASLGVDRCQRINIITGPNSSGKSVHLKVTRDCTPCYRTLKTKQNKNGMKQTNKQKSWNNVQEPQNTDDVHQGDRSTILIVIFDIYQIQKRVHFPYPKYFFFSFSFSFYFFITNYLKRELVAFQYDE